MHDGIVVRAWPRGLVDRRVAAVDESSTDFARASASRLMVDGPEPATAPRIWAVGALTRAVADALEARFNPVAVRGEVSGLSRASSGHVYFNLKDPQGQLRCAMFRRAASLLDTLPSEGDLVEVQGRLAVYEPRGDLQLIVESLSRAGLGAWYERFVRLKARLDAEGLFDPARKRPLPFLPRGIGLVTSTGAAALHDVATALRRRVPHIPVVFSPAPVQGPQAAGGLVAALDRLYRIAAEGGVDVILLVRGGGSIEDLWSFNEEALAHAIVRSPVPLVCGVGHETDFTIADFCADLRAPTPTAAAELVAQPSAEMTHRLLGQQERLLSALDRRIDMASQRLDQVASRMGRPSSRATQQQRMLGQLDNRLRHAVALRLERAGARLDTVDADRLNCTARQVQRAIDRLHRVDLRLQLLDPRLVLQRGYALLTDTHGGVITKPAQAQPGQAVRAQLAEGELDLQVVRPRLL